MNIFIKDTNYKIKYGYLVTSKSEIVPRVVDTMEKLGSEKADSTFITDLMSTVADMLLYGLQKAHADEFGFNFINKNGYEEKYAKVCDLLDDYIESGGKILDLFNLLAEELMNKGFLGEMTETTDGMITEVKNEN